MGTKSVEVYINFSIFRLKNFAQIVILEPQTPKNTLRLDSYIKKNLHNCYSKTLFLELTLAFLTLFY